MGTCPLRTHPDGLPVLLALKTTCSGIHILRPPPSLELQTPSSASLLGIFPWMPSERVLTAELSASSLIRTFLLSICKIHLSLLKHCNRPLPLLLPCLMHPQHGCQSDLLEHVTPLLQVGYKYLLSMDKSSDFRRHG